MKNNLTLVFSIILVGSLNLGCKKESTAPIIEKSNTTASISGNCGYAAIKKNQPESSGNQYNKKRKGPQANALKMNELDNDEIRSVINNAVFKTDIKNQKFATQNSDRTYNHVYIERKRIAKTYDFAIVYRKNNKEVVPIASAKGLSQNDMAAIARTQQWPDEVTNKIESNDY